MAQTDTATEPVDAPMRQRRPALPQQIGPALAAGFGREVPLSFAVRQVVPTGVSVTFAGDVEPDAVLVDWQGGRPWPDVLRYLLRRAGLQAAFRPGAVFIKRPPP